MPETTDVCALPVGGSVQHRANPGQLPMPAKDEAGQNLTWAASGPSTCIVGGWTPGGREGLVVTPTQALLFTPPLKVLISTWYSYFIHGLRAGVLSINLTG